MDKQTLGLIGAMGLLLAAAAAWRLWPAFRYDGDEPASSAPYQHLAPPPPSRKGDADSFNYVRAREKVEVADITRSKLEDYAPQSKQFANSRSTGTQREDIPLSPAVEALLEMLPPPRVTPHVDGRPQLIPAIEEPGGAPLTDGATLQKP